MAQAAYLEMALEARSHLPTAWAAFKPRTHLNRLVLRRVPALRAQMLRSLPGARMTARACITIARGTILPGLVSSRAKTPWASRSQARISELMFQIARRF